MKITMTPPIRNAFDRAAICETYKSRLIELFGSEAEAWKAHNEWSQYKPPIHHWTTYNTIAKIEATKDMLSSERHSVTFIVEP